MDEKSINSFDIVWGTISRSRTGLCSDARPTATTPVPSPSTTRTLLEHAAGVMQELDPDGVERLRSGMLLIHIVDRVIAGEKYSPGKHRVKEFLLPIYIGI